jgi:hypothetical protein
MPKDIVRYTPFDEEKVMREALREGIMRKRNVTVAYIGTKKVGGKDTGEPCVVVGVHDKMHTDLLDDKDIVPKKLKRSKVKTDVVVKARVKPLSYQDPWEYWQLEPSYIEDYYSQFRDLADPNCAGSRYRPISQSFGTYAGCYIHGWIHRPVVGGVSLGTWYEDQLNPGDMDQGQRGTLGVIARDRVDRNLVVLTNNHVLVESGGAYYDTDYMVPDWGHQEVRLDSYITQPAFDDWYYWYRVAAQYEDLTGLEPSEDLDNWIPWLYQKVQDEIVIGNLKRVEPIQFGPAGNNIVDCGIATINKNLAYYGIYGMHDGPYPFASKSEFETGEEVYISSRTTGYRPPPVLYVQSKSAAVNVTYNGSEENNVATYTNQILIATEDEDGYIATGGDSGSPIVAYIDNVYKIIGLLFAGPTDRDTTYANHISDVAEALNIEWWDGTVALETDAYGAMVEDTCYHKIKTIKRVPTHTPEATYGNCEECDNPVEISFTDSSGVNEIQSVMHVPIKPGTTIDKEIYIWFDRDDPQTRFPTSDCPDGPYVITGVKLSVACMEGEYSGQTNLEGQECVDEKWIKARSDGVRGYGCEEMVDDEQKTYKAIGGGFDNSADYLSLGDFVPDSARKIFVKIEIPEGIDTSTEAFPQLVVQYSVENTSSSSQSSSLSVSSSSVSESSESSSFSSEFSSSSESSQSSSSESSQSATSKSSSSDSSSSYSQCGYWGPELTLYSYRTAASSSSANAYRATDTNNTTYWGSEADNLPQYIRYDMWTEARVNRMRLYSYDNPDMMPKSFRLEANNTGTQGDGSEVILINESNLTWTSDEWRFWDIGNDLTYRFYYLVVTDVEDSSDRVRIYNWELYECLEHSYSSTSSSSQSSSSLSSESSSSSNESPSSESSISSSSESSSSESSSSESSSSSSSSESSSSTSCLSSSSSSESSSLSCDIYSDELIQEHMEDNYHSSYNSPASVTSDKLFDGNLTTYAEFDDYPDYGNEYWTVELDDLYWVGKLRLYMDSNVDKRPTEMKFQGSTSLYGPWEDIAHLKDMEFTAGVWNEYHVNPNWPYYNYRLLLLDSNDSRYCRLYEMELYGCCGNSCSSSSSLSVSISVSSSSSESSSSSSESSQSSSSDSSSSISSESSLSSTSSSSTSSESSSSESSSSTSSFSSLSSTSSSSTSSLSSISESSSSDSISSSSSSESKSSSSSYSSSESKSSSSADSKSSSSDSSQSSESSSSESSSSTSSLSSQSSESSASSDSSSSTSSQSSDSSSSTSSLSSSSESSSSESSSSTSSESSESSFSSTSSSSESSSSDSSSSESSSESQSSSSSESSESSSSFAGETGTFYPGANSDDAFCRSDETNFQDANDLRIGRASAAGEYMFIRFNNVSIENSADIASAFVKFTCNITYSATTVRTNIYAHDEDNADAPTTASEIVNATLTSNFEAWDNIPGWTDGDQYDSPDISSVIQEVIDRPGWESGNSIVVQIRNDGSSTNANRIASAYNLSSGSEKPELHISWEGGSDSSSSSESTSSSSSSSESIP